MSANYNKNNFACFLDTSVLLDILSLIRRQCGWPSLKIVVSGDNVVQFATYSYVGLCIKSVPDVVHSTDGNVRLERQNFYTASNLKDLFHNIHPKRIISFVHAIGLTNKL